MLLESELNRTEPDLTFLSILEVAEALWLSSGTKLIQSWV